MRKIITICLFLCMTCSAIAQTIESSNDTCSRLNIAFGKLTGGVPTIVTTGIKPITKTEADSISRLIIYFKTDSGNVLAKNIDFSIIIASKGGTGDIIMYDTSGLSPKIVFDVIRLFSQCQVCETGIMTIDIKSVVLSNDVVITTRSCKKVFKLK